MCTLLFCRYWEQLFYFSIGSYMSFGEWCFSLIWIVCKAVNIHRQNFIWRICTKGIDLMTTVVLVFIWLKFEKKSLSIVFITGHREGSMNDSFLKFLQKHIHYCTLTTIKIYNVKNIYLKQLLLCWTELHLVGLRLQRWEVRNLLNTYSSHSYKALLRTKK